MSSGRRATQSDVGSASVPSLLASNSYLSLSYSHPSIVAGNRTTMRDCDLLLQAIASVSLFVPYAWV